MNILIADDHLLILKGFAKTISAIGKHNVHKAKDKQNLFYILRNNKIDILFQDIKFGNYDARDFLKRIQNEHPNIKIIIITSLSETATIETLLKQGVNGYMLKTDGLDEISKAIEIVMSGETYISANIERTLLGKYKLKKDSEIILTPREKEILHLILNENTTKEIAKSLSLSEKTIEKHRTNLFVKFDVKNVVGLVKQAVLEGFL